MIRQIFIEPDLCRHIVGIGDGLYLKAMQGNFRMKTIMKGWNRSIPDHRPDSDSIRAWAMRLAFIFSIISQDELIVREYLSILKRKVNTEGSEMRINELILRNCAKCFF